ncbi:MAG: hypothetical protein ACK5YR_19290 [Pirellula sp.]
MPSPLKGKMAIAAAISIVAAMIAWSLWNKFARPSGPGTGFVQGNG